jgi:holo-[acyl-carrier protein] synthase
MIIGIGVDILSVSRIQGLIARRSALKLAKRICSPVELQEFKGIQEEGQLRFLCSRWVSFESMTCG